MKKSKIPHFKIIFTLLLCVFLSGGMENIHAANVVCFGDSITAGHSSSSGGYPPKLSSLLNGSGKPANVINKGLSGEKTPAGVSRIGRVLSSVPADFILIMEGTNDIRGGLSAETTRFNLESMINQSRSAGVIPVLATLTPSDAGGNSKTVIPQIWNPMIIDLANSTGTSLADQYAGILPTWGSSNADGLHPNDRGYLTIAQTWYGVVGPMIAADGTSSEGEADSSDDDDSSSFCFIATAAFGSPIEQHVRILRNFRDSYLLTNYPGRAFVKSYYKYSPPVADFISQHNSIKMIVRILLYPLVGLSFFLLKFSISMKLIMSILMGSLTLSVMLVRQRG